MSLPLGKIIKGDCLKVLRTFPDASVQMVMTSPPYWGMRDYKAGAGGESLEGQWGQEPTPDEHVQRLVELFREIWRVLRPDGIVILNYGDCYASAGGAREYGSSDGGIGRGDAPGGLRTAPASLKQKDLVGMPWRVAFALQADGWWLRQRWPWVKLNGMPESVIDRPHVSMEEMFMFTKAPRYFWDAEAVRVVKAESTVNDPRNNSDGHRRDRSFPGQPSNGGTNLGGSEGGRARKNGDWFRESLGLMIGDLESYTAHLREVRDGNGIALDMDGLPIGQFLPTQAYKGAHFATFPEKLVIPCIKAGTSEKGACPACGAPWRREVDKDYHSEPDYKDGKDAMGEGRNRNVNRMGDGVSVTTTGWAPGCECGIYGPHLDPACNPPPLDNKGGNPTPYNPVPCVVLDPFAGSGTTGVVAHKMGRAFVGIDLAGGDVDMGGHTAHERLAAAKDGRSLDEWQGHQGVGQGDLFQPETPEAV